VLHEVVDSINQEQGKAEIEGSNGLSLRLSGDVQRPGERWQGLARTDGGWRRVNLQVEDAHGEVLAKTWRPAYASEGAAQAEEMALLRHAMVNQIVEGGATQMGLVEILTIRVTKARTEVRNLRAAVSRLPEAEKDLMDAEGAFGWVVAAQEEQITL
jgi:hypothetical protein